MIVGSAIALYFSARPRSQQNIAEQIASNIKGTIDDLDVEASNIIKRFREDSRSPLGSYTNYSFYVVTDSRVVRWSSNEFVPSPSALRGNFGLRLLKEANSDFLARKWPIDNNRSLVAVVPLSRRYTITNDYLKTTWNKKIFPYDDILVLDSAATNGVSVCIDSQCPFRISVSSTSAQAPGPVNILAVAFIFALIILAVWRSFFWMRRRWSQDVVFLGMIAALWLVRIAMTSLEFPGSLIQTDLFNPLVFASSRLNGSLGDLLINEVALFIVCYYLFNNAFHFRLFSTIQSAGVVVRYAVSVVAWVMILMAMLFPFVVIQTIYNNSSFILGISESLQFDPLRIAATLSVVLAGICSFLFAHVFIRLLAGDEDLKRIVITSIPGILIFSGIHFLNEQYFLPSLVTGVLYFVVVYFMRLYGALKKLSFNTFTYLFVAILFLSVNGSWAIHFFSKKENFANQFRFAREFLIDRDYFGEYLLGELSRKVSEDQFIQARVATPFLSKDAIRQKIRRLFIPSYFNKYDVEIFVFNNRGELLEGRRNVDYYSLIQNYDHESFRTDYEGVFFISSPAAEITQKYLVVVPVARQRSLAGFVVIELSLKKVIPENVYPELLVDNRFLQFYRSRDISYAVYVNNELSYTSGRFNYESLFSTAWFGYPELHTVGMSIHGYDHIAEEDENGRIAVVSAETPSFESQLANFSFLLVLGLSTILIFILIQGIDIALRGGKLYFSTRIQLFLNLAFFLPLIIVTVMSLRVISRSSQEQITEEYLEKTRRFSEQLSAVLHESLTTVPESNISFETTLIDLSVLSNVEANVFTSSGILFASSQPLIFQNNLVSPYLNPAAYQRIRNGESLFIEEEKVGSLEYYTAFASLKAPSSGALIGVLSIPFFQSVYSLERVQIQMLSNILNIFSVIFVVLVALSYFITRWLTFPLKFITQTLRRTSLTKTNQPLVWKTDDEIGMMVKEYNQMLYSLSESKAELEQTQRERAWREIAQQVAHEIKNPLTPMKLTLQQLERSLNAGNAGPEKFQKAVSSLLSQVDTLNDIASSFSAFAKMPEPVIHRVELVSLVRRIADLHSHDGDIKLEVGVKEVFVMGDDQLLGRTFSNLVLNALQAARPGVAVLVVIRIQLEGDNVLISFADNGRGISPEIAEQIFVPHFTTKKSGSGLGLAIAKQGISQMNGNLWFETTPGIGTTFYISLPLAPTDKTQVD